MYWNSGNADVENLTNMLYKKTRLEDTFGVNMLAVADGRPETLSLRQVIEHHVDFMFEVTTANIPRSWIGKKKKRKFRRAIKACDVIDLIIESSEEAKPGAGKENAWWKGRPRGSASGPRPASGRLQSFVFGAAGNGDSGNAAV